MVENTKIKYTKVPQEEPKDAANVTVLVSDDEATAEQLRTRRPCSTRFRRAVVFLLSAAILYRLLCGFFMNHGKHRLLDPVVPAHPEHTSHAKPGIPCHQGISDCRPIIPWEGPSEFLFKNDEIEGLILNVKGMVSPYGNVFIRQDPSVRDYVNVTNRIFLSEDSLQQDLAVEIKVLDSDVTISIVTPTFSPRRKCINVDTFVTFPSNLNYFRSLSVDVPYSNIKVNNVGDIGFAYVNMKTAKGDVATQRLLAETVEVAAVDGNIRGSFVIGDSLDVKNVDGVIDIVTRAHPWSERVSVHVRSVNGHIRAEMRDLSKKQTVGFEAHSINGVIVATMPNEFQGKFLAKTVLGYAQVEGEELHFDTDMHNIKVGYKGDEEHRSASSVFLNTLNGAVELFFKQRDDTSRN